MKKRRRVLILIFLCVFFLFPVEAYPSYSSRGDLSAQINEQLGAIGRDELMNRVPGEARELMEESGVYELDWRTMLELTPGRFFPVLFSMAMRTLTEPIRALAVMLGVVLLCSLLETLRAGSFQTALSGAFQTVSVLCILTSVAMPILDCVMKTAATIRTAASFMLGFIPIFSAAMISAGQPVSGSTYSIFLMGVCQAVSQAVAQTLIPLMAVYLAVCICGSFVPELNISAAAGGIRTAVTWAMGFMLTIFVALLSIQSMLSHSADGVTVKATKFLITSMVPMAGGVLSEAFMAAQGCLKLVKTTIGAYGIIVAIFTFLPVFLQAAAWLLITRITAAAADVMSIPRVAGILRNCGNVLGMLISAILCFSLLMIVSTSVVMAVGISAG
ncbi:MAG: stage III sporulation protein AE [Oscillospiraceae bacterium]|jgi:stage III sporulation protein AE|nr:stage III sporulation protein AE [Oscillospiraceae bacterium]